MSKPDSDSKFSDSIAQFYDSYLVPLIFQPYAVDLASRLSSRGPTRALELAAGTGVVTRALASALPESVSIVATDLNQAMLDHASILGTVRPVEWRQADAMRLPFADEAFDVVVCQFGVMFFPDRVNAYAETRRVLRPGGIFLFNVWDRIEENEFADTVTTALASMWPADPPSFLARTPHGYFDKATIRLELVQAGFLQPARMVTVAERSRADSPRVPAVAYCQGTPLRSEIEVRDPDGLSAATDVATEALAQRFGPGAVDGKMQAHIVTVVK